MNLYCPRWLLICLAILASLGPADVPQAQAQPANPNLSQDETFQAAVYLLRTTMADPPEPRTVELLRAGRQMGDPALQPYFNHLFPKSSALVLKIHGILGLAECSPQKQIDLARMVTMTGKDAIPVQSEVVSAALDSDLLSDDQARQLIQSRGTDPAIKMLVSAPLIRDKALPSLDHLRDVAKSDNIARRYMALVMLLQSGDASALQGLRAADKSSDPKREKAREMSLEMILRYDFDAAAPWALEVSREPGIVPRVGLLALRVALRYDAPGTMQQWRRQYDSDDDAVNRMRLALLALHLAPWLPADFYLPLSKSSDPMLRQLGLTGAAVAAHKDVAASVGALISMYHPIANNWAFSYAHKNATPADARAIFMDLIRAADEGGDTNRSERMDDALLATQWLFESGPQAAVGLLRPVLASPKTSAPLDQAILVGLIASKTPGAEQVIAGVTFDDIDTAHLALLLQAKPGGPLTPLQMQDLSMLVKGGGGLPQTLRIQAAWMYLKITHQTQAALAAVLNSAS